MNFVCTVALGLQAAHLCYNTVGARSSRMLVIMTLGKTRGLREYEMLKRPEFMWQLNKISNFNYG